MGDLSTVVVTGFGPFRGHTVNASWEAVRRLPDTGIEEELGVKLVVKEIPVVYDYVSKNVPDLWVIYKPILVVHVGVSSFASELKLESKAHKSGYCQPDVKFKLPEKGQCCHGADEAISVPFDLHLVCKEVNEKMCCNAASISGNAGRYLCEFTFYTSLSIDNNRTIFVHVPELNKPFSAEQLAQGLKTIISALLNQMQHQKRNCNCLRKQ